MRRKVLNRWKTDSNGLIQSALNLLKPLAYQDSSVFHSWVWLFQILWAVHILMLCHRWTSLQSRIAAGDFISHEGESFKGKTLPLRFPLSISCSFSSLLFWLPFVLTCPLQTIAILPPHSQPFSATKVLYISWTTNQPLKTNMFGGRDFRRNGKEIFTFSPSAVFLPASWLPSFSFCRKEFPAI